MGQSCFLVPSLFTWEVFMLEKYIEKKLVTEVKKMGGIAAKFVSPGLDGMPDRLVLLPYGKMAFVELKAPGKKPRLLQIRRIKQLQKLGFACYVFDDVKQLGGILGEIPATQTSDLCNDLHSRASHCCGVYR